MSFGRGWLPEAVGRAAPEHPPLRVWITTALVFLAFVTASFAGFARHDDHFLPYNGARIAAFAEDQSGPSTYRVVALGDSRLKNATLDERELVRLVAAFGLRDLRFLRIVDNTATYDRFAALDDAILASRPDLLLIQVDLALRERAVLRWYDDYKRYLARWMRHLLRGARLEPDPRALQVGADCPADDEREDLWARVTTFERRLRVDPSGPNFQAVLKLARRAVRAGSEVALIEIRSSPELRAFYHGTGLDERAALDRLRRESDLPVWRFPPELAGSEHYCDYVHLDAAARARFSQWLVGRIAATARSG